MMSKVDGKWQCGHCGYESDATNVKYHIEAKHLSSSDLYSCPHCQKLLKNRKALNNHLYRYHKNVGKSDYLY